MSEHPFVSREAGCNEFTCEVGAFVSHAFMLTITFELLCIGTVHEVARGFSMAAALYHKMIGL
jgi:hypothetical protein